MGGLFYEKCGNKFLWFFMILFICVFPLLATENQIVARLSYQANNVQAKAYLAQMKEPIEFSYNETTNKISCRIIGTSDNMTALSMLGVTIENSMPYESYIEKINTLPYKNMRDVRLILEYLSDEYSNIAQYYDLGESSDTGNSNRHMLAIEIGKNQENPGVVFIAAQHGDERMGAEAAVELAYMLTEGYQENEKIKEIVDNLNIWIIPVANPYGLDLFDSQRLNKNDIDLNRSYFAENDFNFSFGNYNNDNSAMPDSEPIEVRTIKNLMKNHSNIIGFYDIHGQANTIMYPFSYTSIQAANSVGMDNIGEKMREAIMMVDGTYFEVAQNSHAKALFNNPGYKHYTQDGDPCLAGQEYNQDGEKCYLFISNVAPDWAYYQMLYHNKFGVTPTSYIIELRVKHTEDYYDYFRILYESVAPLLTYLYIEAKGSNNIALDDNANGIPDFMELSRYDLDRDGIPNYIDKCPNFASTNNSDSDGDKVGDVCDNCPDIYNPMVPSNKEIVLNHISGAIVDSETQKYTSLRKNGIYYWQPDHNLNGVGDACDTANTRFVSSKLVVPTTDSAIISGMWSTKVGEYVEYSLDQLRPWNRLGNTNIVLPELHPLSLYYCWMDSEDYKARRWGKEGFCTTYKKNPDEKPSILDYGYSHASDPAPYKEIGAATEVSWRPMSWGATRQEATAQAAALKQAETQNNKFLDNDMALFQNNPTIYWDWRTDIKEHAATFYAGSATRIVNIVNAVTIPNNSTPFVYATTSSGYRNNGKKYILPCYIIKKTDLQTGDQCISDNMSCMDGSQDKRDCCYTCSEKSYPTAIITMANSINPEYFYNIYTNKGLANLAERYKKDATGLSYYSHSIDISTFPKMILKRWPYFPFREAAFSIHQTRPFAIEQWSKTANGIKINYKEADPSIYALFPDEDGMVTTLSVKQGAENATRIVIGLSFPDDPGIGMETDSISGTLFNSITGVVDAVTYANDTWYILSQEHGDNSTNIYIYQMKEFRDSFEIEEIAESTIPGSTFYHNMKSLHRIGSELYLLGSENEFLSFYRIASDGTINKIPSDTYPPARTFYNVSLQNGHLVVAGGLKGSDDTIQTLYKDLWIVSPWRKWNKLADNLSIDMSKVFIYEEDGKISLANQDIETGTVSTKLATVGIDTGLVTIGDVTVNGLGKEIQGGNYCLSEKTLDLRGGFVIDGICTPFNEKNKKSIDTGSTIYTVAGSGNRLYAGTNSAIKVYDITDPLNPVLKQTLTFSKRVYDLAIDGSTMYAATTGGIYKINITSDPISVVTSKTVSGNYQYKILLYNNKLYVADDRGIAIRNKDTLVQERLYYTYGYAVDMALIGNKLLIYWFDVFGDGMELLNADTLMVESDASGSCSSMEITADHGKFYFNCDGYSYRVEQNGTNLDFYSMNGDMLELQDNHYYNNFVYWQNGKYLKISTLDITKPVCGNGVIEAGEVCEDDTKACIDLGAGWSSGTAYCNSTCSGYNTDSCESNAW